MQLLKLYIHTVCIYSLCVYVVLYYFRYLSKLNTYDFIILFIVQEDNLELFIVQEHDFEPCLSCRTTTCRSTTLNLVYCVGRRPVEVRLQTLFIVQDGDLQKYDFKPCLSCRTTACRSTTLNFVGRRHVEVRLQTLFIVQDHDLAPCLMCRSTA